MSPSDGIVGDMTSTQIKRLKFDHKVDRLHKQTSRILL